MFANGTIGGSGYNFNITFFNDTEINMVDDPCTSPYGHHLICMNDWENINNSRSRIDNGIIVTDKWILTSATACLNIYNNPWNEYFIRAGTHNLTAFENGSIIKDYHIFSNENQNQDGGCNQNDDYCMIELETPLVISEDIQAIGFQHFTPIASTTMPMDFTTSWDSTGNPEFTSTAITTTTSTTSTTTTIPANDRRKRQAAPTTTTTTTTTPTTTTPTTTTSTTTTPSTTSTKATRAPATTTMLTTTTRGSTDVFAKCWISAWSDNNLRTYKVDIDPTNYCYPYYPTEHTPLRKHKEAHFKKRMKANKKARDKKANSKPHSFIEDVMDLLGLNNYGERTHICLDKLRLVSLVNRLYRLASHDLNILESLM